MLRWLAIFFRDFLCYNLVFTALFIYYQLLYTTSRWFYLLPYLFWIKLVGFSLFAFAYYQTRRHRLYFYHNLGMSSRRLLIIGFSLDLLLAMIISIIFYAFTRS